MATSKNWQSFVHNGRHNHKIAVYHHNHAQDARLTKEHHVPPVISYDFFENKTLIMQLKEPDTRKNRVEEVLCLSPQRGYTVFYRTREESNVLIDIAVAHPTLIAMIRTWLYVLIIDTTYKTNKYNIPLLEAVGMTPTEKTSQ
ncbi:hypothetical protein M9H77_33610 [Catharanthus roseus]|uniref:Uncharacterized protein n=1 Tax=Catharanthus roseus TaxID=4058 RepID=A0ACB9ZME4_CATRO|nr:hypothetical protein M9H77_33610 [Catharanthus roseus]